MTEIKAEEVNLLNERLDEVRRALVSPAADMARQRLAEVGAQITKVIMENQATTTATRQVVQDFKKQISIPTRQMAEAVRVTLQATAPRVKLPTDVIQTALSNVENNIESGAIPAEFVEASQDLLVSDSIYLQPATPFEEKAMSYVVENRAAVVFLIIISLIVVSTVVLSQAAAAALLAEAFIWLGLRVLDDAADHDKERRRANF